MTKSRQSQRSAERTSYARGESASESCARQPRARAQRATHVDQHSEHIRIGQQHDAHHRAHVDGRAAATKRGEHRGAGGGGRALRIDKEKASAV